MENFDFEDEKALNEIRGASKKPSMSLLNQKNVSKWEMDELFSDEFEEEF